MNEFLVGAIGLSILFVAQIKLHYLWYEKFKARRKRSPDSEDISGPAKEPPRAQYLAWYISWILMYSASTVIGFLVFLYWIPNEGFLHQTKELGLIAVGLAFIVNMFTFVTRHGTHDIRMHSITYATLKLYIAIVATLGTVYWMKLVPIQFISENTEIGLYYQMSVALTVIAAVIILPSRTFKKAVFWLIRRVGSPWERVFVPPGHPRSLLSVNIELIDMMRLEEEGIRDVHALAFAEVGALFRNTRYPLQRIVAWMIDACDRRRQDLEDVARARGDRSGELVKIIRKRKAKLLTLMETKQLGAYPSVEELTGRATEIDRISKERAKEIDNIFGQDNEGAEGTVSMLILEEMPA